MNGRQLYEPRRRTKRRIFQGEQRASESFLRVRRKVWSGWKMVGWYGGVESGEVGEVGISHRAL